MGSHIYHNPIRGVSAVDGTNKAKIERAALTLFAEHGVDGVSTKSIAVAAGVSEGLLYRHFTNKKVWPIRLALLSAIIAKLQMMIGHYFAIIFCTCITSPHFQTRPQAAGRAPLMRRPYNYWNGPWLRG